MSQESFVKVDGVNVGYGATRVLDSLDLSIRKGEFVALLGSSGCGKTTLLRSIAGFNQPSTGAIWVDGRDVTRLPPDKRGMALVFQSYALWPHMTVDQNIGYGLKLKGYSRAAIASRVGEMEALLGLEGLGGRKPAALSGGQRQRVALGRALAINPEILLLDEPLSNLDARIRLTVRHEISALQKRLGITAVHVTHDREEAMVMADRIVILNRGRIAQQGSPEDVYNNPSSSFVAAFMGAENVLTLKGHRSGDHFHILAGNGNAACSVPLAGRALHTGLVEARFRAEAVGLSPGKHIGPEARPDVLELEGTVLGVSYPGGTWRHAVSIAGQQVLLDAPQAFRSGETVTVQVPFKALFLFDAPGGTAEPAQSDSSSGTIASRALEASEA
ncbi:MAG: ABC transporter ATP-binding protein [Phyllobacterium sp.]